VDFLSAMRLFKQRRAQLRGTVLAPEELKCQLRWWRFTLKVDTCVWLFTVTHDPERAQMHWLSEAYFMYRLRCRIRLEQVCKEQFHGSARAVTAAWLIRVVQGKGERAASPGSRINIVYIELAICVARTCLGLLVL
jgi:hypothetical protein